MTPQPNHEQRVCRTCKQVVSLPYTMDNHYCSGQLPEQRVYYDRSKCHQAPVHVEGSDEGTNYYVCDECDKPCDLYSEGQLPEPVGENKTEANSTLDILATPPVPDPGFEEVVRDNVALFITSYGGLDETEEALVAAILAAHNQAINRARRGVLEKIIREHRPDWLRMSDIDDELAALDKDKDGE